MGANGYFLFLGKQIELFVDVKDASSGKLFYPLNPVFVPWSCGKYSKRWFIVNG
jgi:hypothetical protein